MPISNLCKKAYKYAVTAIALSPHPKADRTFTASKTRSQPHPIPSAIASSPHAKCDRLRKVLSFQGILVTHPVMTAIKARVLRSGSNQETDKLLLDLIRLWHEEEERLGIEIDARVFAYVVSNDDQLDRALLHLGLVQPNPYWRFQAIYGLLWSRGNILCSRALSSYNPFAVLPDADRELLLDVLQVNEHQVWLDDADWREQVEEAFKRGVSVSLIARPDARGDLKSAILGLAAEPVELAFLQVYSQVEGVQRHPRGLAVRLRVREAVQ